MSRNICKEVKFNNNEWKIINRCAEKYDKRTGTYIREAAIDGKIKIYNLTTFKNIIISFNNIGNKIDAIAKVVNSTKTITIKDMEDLREIIKYFNTVFEDYLLPIKFDFFNNEQFLRKGGQFYEERKQNGNIKNTRKNSHFR